MNNNANSEKPHLTLIKKHVSSPRVQEDEFIFDFGEIGHEEDEVFPDIEDFFGDKNDANINFSSLLKNQSQLIDRIQYFADDIEFNLD